jgi:signal transduction histidine kinase
MQQKSAQEVIKTIQAILDVNQFSVGEEYFKELVRNLAQHLRVKFCFIGRPEDIDQTKVKTHVVWAGGQFMDNFVYDLAGTPCKNIVDGKRVGLYSPHVADQFPEDEMLGQMGVESYLGAPILDKDNNMLGLIVILDSEPIEDRELYTAIMELMAGRVAAELERHDLQANLKRQVEERTAELQARMEELERTRQELVQSEKMASLGRLVAGFAHELNTPIGVAVSSASVLDNKTKEINTLLSQDEIDGDALDAILNQFSEASALITSNLKRASELVNSFKRTAVDQSSEDIRRFNVNGMFDDIIKTLHSRFKPSNVQIQIDCADDINVYSVPGSVEQIITNLLLNSLEHAYDDGQNGLIKISAKLNQERLHIEYQDNGKGMTAETQAKIFEPFFTTNRARGGSGLGMYISYNLVTSQLHGDMQCSSALGEGTTFSLDFPIQDSLPASL